ncbi:phosphotransferase family protein [Tepidicaulis sp. LMO-SS28]|uniref:phosphotransferase family protein n=1 Tax=Tepidicaulis sp. LMO-SS28 TaxID=3447455 RepID=UPI003EE38DAB
MSNPAEDLSTQLGTVLREKLGDISRIEKLKRLSGGASQETWAFEGVTDKGALPLILRRAPGGIAPEGRETAVTLATEAALIRLADKAGVPVPPVRYVLEEADGIGPGFVMDRVEGETIARKILRDEEYAEARPKLARQCGEILAKLHSVPMDSLPKLRHSPAEAEIEQYWQTYKTHGHPHPVFELAFKWLRSNLPAEGRTTLVHGDFRHGNLIIGPDGVRAVLDWEIAHTGDPMEDMGWICVNSWRFGNIDQPVGGFGKREDMFAGYEAAGGPKVDPERVKFWEILGTLKWGIMCTTMYEAFKSGMDRSVERAAIGRRSSETEIDLLALLAPRS